MADGQSGILRIDLHRCHVETALRRRLLEEKARDAVGLRAQRGTEREPDPRRVTSGFHLDGLALDVQHRAAPRAGSEAKRNAQRTAILSKDVVRSFEYALEALTVTLKREPIAAGATVVASAGTKVGETALGPLQIRRTHGGEQTAVELLRRKRDRNAQNGAADVMVAKYFPERLAFAAQFSGPAIERNEVPAELPEFFGTADFR